MTSLCFEPHPTNGFPNGHPPASRHVAVETKVGAEPAGGASDVAQSCSQPSLSVLRLLQICSPAFPIGAFAYSQGLEQAAELEWVADPAGLQRWLCGLLEHNLAMTDLPLLCRAYDIWSGAAPTSHQHAERLCEVVNAYRETAELRAEEQHIGRALARILSHLGITEASPFVDHDAASYLVLFALAGAHFGVPRSDVLAGFAFAWAENQVAAATRVIRMGQLAAQGVLSAVIERIPAAVTLAQTIPDDEIGYSSPAVFLASAWHEEQYSRLFRS